MSPFTRFSTSKYGKRVKLNVANESKSKNRPTNSPDVCRIAVDCSSSVNEPENTNSGRVSDFLPQRNKSIVINENTPRARSRWTIDILSRLRMVPDTSWIIVSAITDAISAFAFDLTGKRLIFWILIPPVWGLRRIMRTAIKIRT